ncbi:hypothetical protein H6G89_22235 [Oscillatoria sp. FACHB-1407]|uniref:type IV pilin-like G/H family protein n=1 Tax=Oscillatoria sp. FACHB-1407 TaxID=2692847 RepID=UPI001685B95F|nr:hypothetical protein [Oscillatoria sp. FACHB-1407]
MSKIMIRKFVLVVACILIIISSTASIAVACSRMRISEATTYVGMMNRIQQQYFLENQSFARSLEELNRFAKAQIPVNTNHYRFQVHLKNQVAFNDAHYIGDAEPCMTKCEFGITSLFGRCFDSCCNPLICFFSRRDCVYSVIGVVFPSNRRSHTQAILCKGSTPDAKQPFLKNGEYVCPSR